MTATQARIVGDDMRDGPLQNPFHLTFSPGLIPWLMHANAALLLTTYQAGKVVLIGPNRGKLTVSERNSGRAMAMAPVEDGLLLSTEYAVWRFQNGLRPGRVYDDWDTILLPRSCHATGAVDTHDIAIDVRTNKVVCRGLSMPHTPRLHRGKLWVLEAGRGWLGWVDVDTGEYHRLTWCPGFVRGLRFHGDFALVGLSKPRDKTFKGLPLAEELASRGVDPECGIYVIRLSDGEVVHKVSITGSVAEIYDVMAYPETQCPMIVGLEAKEVRQLVDIGMDYTTR